MRTYINIAVISGLLILGVGFKCPADEFSWQNISRENLGLNAVLISQDNPNLIYAGTDKGIIKSEDGGANWRPVLTIKGQNHSVNFLLFGHLEKNSLYAATANGLFLSVNGGKDWKRIFQGRKYLENECTALAVLPNGIYLGTKAGLFSSKDKGRSWHKESGEIGASCVLAIASNIKNPDCIYVACIGAAFMAVGSNKPWEKIFAMPSARKGEEIKEETIENGNEEERYSGIRYITIDPNNPNYVYLATSNGVYKSLDKGKDWELLSNFGLFNKDVEFLLVSTASCLYGVTKSGIFEYVNDRWQELSFGLAAVKVRFLALDSRSNLYAACDKGLFKTAMVYSGNNTVHTSTLYYKDEPQINDVQQAAIKYAEVSSQKIKDWRRKARLKAVLPKLTVGLDRSENTNYEIYTSATTRYVYEGPHDRSNGWDVTLSWELGDLIWSEAQTSIDVRSKLMVELREDILDEVTKLYFERIRVKMEIDNLGIEENRKRAEKELKLEELSASLDALTDGYFSSHLPENKQNS